MLQPSAPSVRPAQVGALQRIPDFGANPGALSMLAYVPDSLQADAPLIVLLHGCGEDAAAFAVDTGWVALADRLKVALVLPEQADGNNRQRCFNWFRPAHVARGQGEAESIRGMIATAIRLFRSDPRAVHVAGLSAGGAMAAALLAAYPDVFAAGASVAGLPVGAANGAASALARMAQAGPDNRSAEEWGALVRHAGPPGYTGPWPRLSVWHGALDTIVDPGNARLLAAQWQALHGLGGTAPIATGTLLAHREAWGNRSTPSVELWTVPALVHGYPVDIGGPIGSSVIPIGLSATDRIAAFWGLR